MELVQVDVVGPEAAQTRLDLVHDVDARGAGVVGAGADGVGGLRRDDDVVAGDPERRERAAEHLLRVALGVDVRGVDEVDAGVEGSADDAVDVGLADAAGRGVAGVVDGPEGHRAEGELGHEQTGAAEGAAFHRGGRTRCRKAARARCPAVVVG